MYDDHSYCRRCGLHSHACWCFASHPPMPDDGPVCRGKPGHDDPAESDPLLPDPGGM
jgi:hypothetical protein